MNRKQFALILLALAILGGAGLVLVNRHNQLWAGRESGMGDKVLPNFRFNDVAAIHIQSADGFNLVRVDGVWRVRERSDYPANYEQIKQVLLKARDLKVIRAEKIGPSQLGRVGLNEPGQGAESGTLVQFKDARGEVLDSLLIGKMHLRPQSGSDPFRLRGLFDGRYVLSPKNAGHVLLISDDLACISPEPGSWLARDFFHIENAKSITLVSTNGANLWTLTRESGSWPWNLSDAAPGELLDANVASQIAEALAFLNFVDVASAKVAPHHPLTVFIETFDHFFYTLQAGAKQPDGNYLLTAAVRAAIPAKRIAATDETPENKKKLDDDFQIQTKQLQDKLAREKALTRCVYVSEPNLLDLILRNRSHLLQKPMLGSTGAN
jgi:hypothetical protein